MRFKTGENILSMEDRLKQYTVNENGCHIWSGCLNKAGYGIFHTKRNGVGKMHKVHRAAYMHKHNCVLPPTVHIRHMCNTPACINVDHMKTGTHKENMQDAVDAKRHSWGERSAFAKLTEIDVLRIRKLIAEGKSNREIADAYNVCYESVWNIKNNKTWRYLA